MDRMPNSPPPERPTPAPWPPQDPSTPRYGQIVLAICLVLAGVYIFSGAGCNLRTKDSVRRDILGLGEGQSVGWFVASVDRDTLFAKVGHPTRTQHFNGMLFWYWSCIDGTVQARVLERSDNSILIMELNDY